MAAFTALDTVHFASAHVAPERASLPLVRTCKVLAGLEQAKTPAPTVTTSEPRNVLIEELSGGLLSERTHGRTRRSLLGTGRRGLGILCRRALLVMAGHG